MQKTSPARIRLLVALATLTSTFNVLDRSLVNILAESIKLDLGLSDTQLGLLTGTAFAFFYAAVGLPIARYVDRPSSDRPLVVALCISVWSLMTILSGVAANFFQMVAARILVATGESGSGPALFSIIHQSVPANARARAIGVYGMGPPLGMLLGLVVGGWLVDLVGWRMTFVVVGAPGLLLALAIRLTLDEPRKRTTGSATTPASPLGFAATMRVLLGTPEFVWLVGAFATSGIVLLGMPAFTGVYLIRVLGLTAGKAGLILGLTFGIAGIAGALCGGALGDFLAKRSPAYSVLSPALGLLIGVPAALIAFTTADWRVFAAVFWIQWFGASFYLGPAVARVQSVVPQECHATSTFLAFMMMQLVGLGLGPVLIGFGSDLLRPEFGVLGLQWMLLTASVFAAVPALFYVRASGVLNRRERLRPA